MAKKTTASEAFLKAIGEEPDEDAHRLVYADWLDDHGQPERAEFIRVQCALAKMGLDDPRQRRLAAREQALYQAHQRTWLGELPEWARPRYSSTIPFRRGFVASISCTARAWLKGANAMLRRVPPPEELVLWHCKGVVGVVSRSPHLAGISSLGLCVLQDLEEVGELAAATQLHRLREFAFCTNCLGNDGLATLLKAPFLAGLKRLHLIGNQIGDAGIVKLARAPSLAGLEELDLSCNRLGASAAKALASSPHLAGLRRLNLGENVLNSAAVGHLAASRTLIRLTSLDLTQLRDRGGAGLAALADSPLIEQLTELRLAYGRIGPEGAEALAATRRPTRLENLNLLQAGLGDRGAIALARSPIAARLLILDLSHNDISEEGASALAASPHLGRLETLELFGQPIGDEAVVALARSPHLVRLTTLTLSREGLSAATLQVLRERFHDNYWT
jgi:uncharacterized protein (TIGR02996 family)